MMISRLPKKRASSENAPGPRRAIAIDKMIILIIARWLSNGIWPGKGIHANAMPMPPIATKIDTSGVIKPANRKAPPVNARPARPHPVTPWFGL